MSTEEEQLLPAQHNVYINYGDEVEEAEIEEEEFLCCCKCSCCCSCWLSCWDAILSNEQIEPSRNFLTFWKDSLRHLWRGLTTNLSLKIASKPVFIYFLN